MIENDPTNPEVGLKLAKGIVDFERLEERVEIFLDNFREAHKVVELIKGFKEFRALTYKLKKMREALFELLSPRLSPHGKERLERWAAEKRGEDKLPLLAFLYLLFKESDFT